MHCWMLVAFSSVRTSCVTTGLKGAIRVDRRMATDLPDVYAAGDCVEAIARTGFRDQERDVSDSVWSDTRVQLLRRGLRLEYITLAWNVVGVIVLAAAAIAARSVALAGFGMDSLIEIGASTVVVWQLPTRAEHASERRCGSSVSPSSRSRSTSLLRPRIC